MKVENEHTVHSPPLVFEPSISLSSYTNERFLLEMQFRIFFSMASLHWNLSQESLHEK